MTQLLVNFLLQNVLFVGKWDTCADLVLIIPKDSMLMVVAADFVALWNILRKMVRGFPGGAVVENLPANPGDTGSSPGLGRSHMPQSN